MPPDPPASNPPNPRDSAPRRRLRLSVILTQLRDDARALDARIAATGAQAAAPSESRTDDPATAGASQSPADAKPGMSVGEIIDRARDAGFGFVIAFLTIFSMPVPGASVPFGIMIMFGALQMLVGRHRPWLPRWLRLRRVSTAVLDRVANRLSRWTACLEVAIRPRFLFMVRGPGWLLCAASIFVLALGLSLPLPIPWSNVFFAAPILIYAIALLESDGLLVMLAHAIVAAQTNLIVRTWDVVWVGLRGLLEWIGASV